MAPRISYGKGAVYPVGEETMALFGCLATFVLPVFWALRWLWRRSPWA